MNSNNNRNSSSRPRPSNRTYRAPTEKQWNRMSRADQLRDQESRKADQVIARANAQKYERDQANWRQRNTRSWRPNQSAQQQRPSAQRPNHFAKTTTFKPTAPPIATNPFAGLDSDSDSDSDTEPEKTEVGPTLPSQKSARQMDQSASMWTGFRENPPTKSNNGAPKPTAPVLVKTPARKVSTAWETSKTGEWGDSDDEDVVPLNDAWD